MYVKIEYATKLIWSLSYYYYFGRLYDLCMCQSAIKLQRNYDHKGIEGYLSVILCFFVLIQQLLKALL
jgi:hypothetical protein